MRWLFFLPLAGVVALFTLSNREPVSLQLWPFEPALQLPLGIAMLLAAAGGFLLGALIVWLSGLPARSRSRAPAAIQSVVQAGASRVRTSTSVAPAAFSAATISCAIGSVAGQPE